MVSQNPHSALAHRPTIPPTLESDRRAASTPFASAKTEDPRRKGRAMSKHSEPPAAKSVSHLRFVLLCNRLKGFALRFYNVFCKWGVRQPFETRFLTFLLPICFGLLFSFVIWVFLPGLPALYGTALVATLLYLAVTASAFFRGCAATRTESALETLRGERASMLGELAVAKEQAAERRECSRKEHDMRRAQEQRAQEQERAATEQARILRLQTTRQKQAARNGSLRAGRCPDCGAELQVMQKGYDTGTGLACCCLGGPLGLLGGMLGSGQKTRVCRGCGHEFKFGW
jgi:hypothetical protein